MRGTPRGAHGCFAKEGMGLFHPAQLNTALVPPRRTLCVHTNTRHTEEGIRVAQAGIQSIPLLCCPHDSTSLHPAVASPQPRQLLGLC